MIIFSIGMVHPGQKALDLFIIFVQTLKNYESPELFHGICWKICRIIEYMMQAS